MVNEPFNIPGVTKTEFLLTIPMQCQGDKWYELREISVGQLLVDPIPNCKAERSQKAWFLRIADLHSCVPCNEINSSLFLLLYVCLSW